MPTLKQMGIRATGKNELLSTFSAIRWNIKPMSKRNVSADLKYFSLAFWLMQF